MLPFQQISKQSPHMAQICVLCERPFAPGDELVLCPVDFSRHHTQCWRSNDNNCATPGCTGHGEIAPQPMTPRRRWQRLAQPFITFINRYRTDTLPMITLRFAQSCLLLSIAAAILLFAVGCFGLWALADYIAVELLGWQYRAPLPGLLYFILI